jgi:hypothetical protein
MIQDEYGNKLYRRKDTIFLHLTSEQNPRKLGIIDEENQVIVITRESSKHLHRLSNSYGFNLQLLKTATVFNSIRLIVDNIHYLIPIKLIKEKGKFLFFKQQGFELQVFLSLDEILNCKI